MALPSIHEVPEEEYEVTPLELFFDLVFVFAVSQLSHHLLSHLSWRGAAETLVMLLAILTVWSYTSTNVRSRLHLVGGIALVLVGLVTLAVRSDVALILVGTSLTTLAILDQRRSPREPPAPTHAGA